MSKRLGTRLAVAITALGAMTLLSGCGEENRVIFSGAWAPVGYVPAFWIGTGYGGDTSGGGGQTATGGGGGGVSVGSVGGNQVSTGMAVQ